MEENDLIAVESLDSIDAEHNVFTEPTHPINPIAYFFMSTGKSLLGLCMWFVGLLWSMVLALGNFFMMVGIYFKKGVLGICNFFKRKFHQFRYNDWSGRLSYLLFGTSSFKNKKFAFGALYIIFQIGYIVLFATSGLKCILMLGSLGTKGAYEDFSSDPDFPEMVPGDNSIMILIYGLLWALSLLVFLYVWNRSINDGYYNYRVNNLKKYEEIYNFNAKHVSDQDTEVNYDFLNTIENKKERAYSLYLMKGTIRHKKEHDRAVDRQLKKLDKIECKQQKYIEGRNKSLENLKAKLSNQLKQLEELSKEQKVSDAKLAHVKERQRIKFEMFNNKTISGVNKLELVHRAQNHRVEELTKRYSPFVEMQLINNNKKYGVDNNYYKHLAKLESEITFYSNYGKLVNIYNEGLVKAEEKNQENVQLGIDLGVDFERKVNNTKTKFAGIRERKALLKAELKQAEVDYKLSIAEFSKAEEQRVNDLLAEIKNSPKEEVAAKIKELKLEKENNIRQFSFNAKAVLIDKTTSLMRKINDLPQDKNIKALEKEEIKESKRAYARDKKYLKTDYTGVELAFEDVVNELIVEHKIDYKLAVAYVKSMIVRNEEGCKVLRSEEEAQELLKEKIAAKNEYVEKYPNKYDVKFRTFWDSIKSLFNNKFYITILFLPILGIVLFSIVPLIFSIFVAFTNYSKGYEPPMQLFTWIGFENFKTIFNPDPNTQFAMLPSALGKTLGWTLTWAIIATFSNYILGIVVALMINKDGIKFKKLWRTVFVMTIAIPQFISLLSIGTLIKDSGAIGHWYFETFGSRLGFGTDGSDSAVLIAKIVIILVNVWIGIPYTILSTTGILLNIPKDLYESAKVDGTSTFTQFTKITMPYILFVTGPYLITQFIGNINNFNVIFFLTGGGPSLAGSSILGLGETDLLITFIYKVVTSTSNPQYGIASAIGILVFIICSFISIVMYNKSGSIKEEDQFQ